MPDIPGNSSTTSSITVGSTVTGSIEVAYDQDWFRISLVAGQTIQITLNGSGAMPLADPYLRLRDASGTLLRSNDDTNGLNSLINFTATTSGVYYIDAGAYDAFTGDYSLTVVPSTPPAPLPIATIAEFANQLTHGYWNGSSRHYNVTEGGWITVNLTALTSQGATVARLALQQWADITGIRFAEVSSGGQMTFDDNQAGAFSSSSTSGGIIISSTVNVSTQWLSDYGSGINSYGYQTYVHEIGHALGLGHAGNYNSSADYPQDARFRNDSWPMSVMSYFSASENTYFADQGFTHSYLGTPMLADIAAMRVLYGLSTTTRAGDTTYGFGSNAGNVFNASLYPTIAYTVFDSGGIDSLNYSGFTQNQVINLGQGEFSSIGGRIGNVTIAIGTVIENAVGGSGNDTIRGNDAPNILVGSGGDDQIASLGGNDIIMAGAGNDQYDGGEGIDTVSYAEAAGGIIVNGNAVSSVNGASGFGNDTLISIETIIGSGFDDSFFGTAAAQRFEGGGGNDTMTGSGGADVFRGGTGADTFRDSLASFNGDTILDLTAEDRIIFADANVGSFTFSLSGSTLTYSGGSMTLSGFSGQLVARAVDGGVGVQLNVVSQFGGPALAVSNFGSSPAAGSWTTNDRYPRMIADVNGDGRNDIVGFGENGAFVSLGGANGTFGVMNLAIAAFGAGTVGGGWSSNDVYLRELGDVNGDGRADIVGFGLNGVYVSLGTLAGTFAAPTLATTAFGAGPAAGGWSSNDRYLRQLADVNGDGRVDIVGFGESGVYVALAGPNATFGAPTLAIQAFGSGAVAGGWSSDNQYAREVADVNGDGRADIIGFGIDGVYVSLANANGTFAAPVLGLNQFGAGAAAGGWSSDNIYPREVGDVDGDGRADIVGFGNDGVIVALGNGNGTFQPSMLDLRYFGLQPSAGSWTSEDAYPRQLADMNGDGALDIVGFSSNGVMVALSTGDIF